MESQFFEKIKEEATVYGKALSNVGKLRLIAIISRVLGLFLLIFTIVLCLFALFSFGAVAAISALSACMPVWAAALIIGSVYIIIIALAIIFRRPLFIHPFIALLTDQVIGTQEQLDLETVKAEHEVELQNVRLETKVENATREIDFYFRLASRIWSWISGWRRK